MRLLLTGARVFHQGKLSSLDVAVDCDRIVGVGTGISSAGFDAVFHLQGKILIPGFVDVHVHLRQPGFFEKETMTTGTMAAARGGYTAVCAMPNLNPPPDSVEHMEMEREIIRREARVRVYPYAAITVGQRGEGELADIEGLAPLAVGFSDDGRGVQREELMRNAMERVKAAGGFIAAHCEDDALLRGGYIHDGEYARLHGHRGICSESEWGQVKRDLELVRRTGCRYHVCHVSTRESIQLIRRAKEEGLPVSCETAPHYLTMCDMDLREEGRFKMNPPVRSAADRDALVQGLADGIIDVVATDHAPHTAEEKSGGLEKSLMGVVGLETAFPVLYTRLVKTGALTLETLLERMCASPRRLLGIGGEIREGEAADLAVLDLDADYTIDSASFLSKGKATPFEGWRVSGENVMTMVGGQIVWSEPGRLGR